MSAAERASRPSLRDAALVARFELLESVRTRRVLVLVLLFVVGGGLSGWGFARFLGEAEQAAGAALSAPVSKRPGAALERLQQTDIWQKIVGGAVDDPEAAAALAKVPPLALVFAWLAMMFAPLLVLFTSSDTIAQEVETRALRYTLLRTGRLEYVTGKFLGQCVLLTAVVALSAVAFLAVSAVQTSGLSPLATGLMLVRFWPWIVVDALPWLALALAVSMLARTAQGGRALAIGAALLMAILHGLAGASWLRSRGPVAGALLDLVDYATPFPRGFGLLAPVGPTMARSLAICLLLSAAYLGGALALFRRRDV